MISVAEVQERLAKIRATGRDFEAAHVFEDQLHVDVLRAIAEGAENAPELAWTALASQQIPGPRYCA